ncbi:hypothetical protein ACH5Y9_11185 [Methylomonas sp. BW4-1]|uniref:hypothetical protein n=1 Tax=Methylomonas sp. BW4-1 TaxID=3376685 RepID=UPI0040412688
MKVNIIILGLTAMAISGLLVASKLQLEESIVSARYEMLACEGCYHLTVEKSKGGELDGETIIPVSSKVNIVQLIDSIAITKEPLCFRGKLYRFNWNLFGIDPDGKRFEVIEKLNPIICAGF